MNQQSDNLRGALFMMAGMAGLVLNDTMMKLVSSDLNLYQTIFVRGVFVCGLFAAISWHQGILGKLRYYLSTLIALRLLGEIGATICFLIALFNMPIANATAILQVSPLTITLASVWFLSASVGWRRYLAIAIGMIGVLVIIRPGAEGFSSYSLLALAAVGFVTLRDVVTRQLPTKVPSVLVALATSIGMMLVGAFGSLASQWQPVTTTHVAMLGLAGIFLFAGYLFSIMTMRVGDVSFVTPFRYFALVWAIIIGIAVFGELPDFWTIIGSAIVVITGVYSFMRERRAEREAAAEQ